MAIEAFMLPAAAGGNDSRLAVWHPPARAPADWTGVVLYVHPFAEEMNKTRRMAALQARALSAAGFAVLQLDLKGCGDSSGEFGDATWADWLADLGTARQWLRSRSSAPLTLWGLRAGCLLAAEAAATWHDERCDFVFWQPTATGSAVLRQFLRHAAAAAFMDGGGKGVVDKLRQQLGSGQAVEVGGYRIHPALAAGLEQARLPLPQRLGRVAWFEVSALPADTAAGTPPSAAAAALTSTAAGTLASSAAAPTAPAASAPESVLSLAGATAAADWRAGTSRFHAQVVGGPPFWQTAEIETAPALLAATSQWMAAR